MSAWYSLGAVLHVPLQEKYIKNILEIGAQKGCKYHKTTTALEAFSNEALENILAQFKKSEITHNYAYARIGVDYKDTFFDLCIAEKKGYLYFRFSLDGTWWKDKEFIDYEPYIRLFFNMCDEIPILWINAADSGYDEEFYCDYKDRECALREEPDIIAVPNFKVDVTILPDWTADTFNNLLKHGAAAGWHYYMPLQLDSNRTELSTEEAVSYILEESPAGKTEVSLICIIDNTKHLLTFRLRFDTFFMFTLKPLSESVDLPRTVQHALDLCTDFCILELNTFDARYNYYKEPFNS